MTKVLIIEDEAEIVSFLKPELIYEGYEVDSSDDGRAGFDKIQGGNYDIVLLDIMLPDFNGIEICRREGKKTFRKEGCYVFYKGETIRFEKTHIDIFFHTT